MLSPLLKRLIKYLSVINIIYFKWFYFKFKLKSVNELLCTCFKCAGLAVQYDEFFFYDEWVLVLLSLIKIFIS